MRRMNIFSILCSISTALLAGRASAQDHYTGPIIDMHIHAETVTDFGGPMTVCTNEPGVNYPGLDPQQPITVERAAACAHPLQSAQTNDELIAQTAAMFKRYNIYAVTDGSLAELKAWEAASPGRIIPALDWHKDNAATPDDFRPLFAAHRFRVFAEIAPQYHGMRASDPSLEPYFALAEELDIPIGFHLGEGPPGAPYISGYGGYRASNTSSLQLEDVLVKHPKLRLYVMHYGSPLVEDTIALLYSHPQVYVDIAQNDWGFPKPHFYRQLQMLVDAGFEKRIMFGSDQMIWPETIRIAIETVEGADFLSAEQKADIFYNNAARFLRLSDEEIARHHRN